MTESCTTCRFGHTLPWSTETAHWSTTFCRFDPPEFISPSSSALKPVQPDGWCGKHEPVKADVTPTESNWPAGCHSPNSCDRNGRCGYIGCVHDGENIRALADVIRPLPAPGNAPNTVRSQKRTLPTKAQLQARSIT